MRASRFVRIAFVLASCTASAAPAYAQDTAAAQSLRAEIDQLKQDFNTRIVGA